MPKSPISYKFCDLNCREVIEKLWRSCGAKERGKILTLLELFWGVYQNASFYLKERKFDTVFHQGKSLPKNPELP